MRRLTTNKAVHDMGMFELSYNSCYVKDGKARFRDFENDFDARELAMKLLDKYANIPNEFTCEEDFDGFIADALHYGTDNILGLIAVFYRNLCAMADLRGRLKEYEDLEEQGELLKFPCEVGDTWKDLNITDFLCKRKSRYQKKYNQVCKKEKEARLLLGNEPDREDVKSYLNQVIKLKGMYCVLIEFIEELQEGYF